jgi:hypothetical protein
VRAVRTAALSSPRKDIDMTQDDAGSAPMLGSQPVAWVCAAALMLAGCVRDSSKYLVTVSRPDGSLHKTFELQSDSAPRVASSGGCLEVWSSLGGDVCRTDAYPAGWLVEVAKQEETE